jgi:hypothetical protein
MMDNEQLIKTLVDLFKSAGGTDEELSNIRKILSGEPTDQDYKKIYEEILANPRLRNFQRRKEIASAVEGGIDTLKFLSNRAMAQGQINKARELEKGLKEPTAPAVPSKSQELVDATEQARQDMYAPPKELDPILEANMRALAEGRNVAQVASGGQAGIYGSMSQANINRAREANNALIPAMENIKRQKQARYDQLIAAGINQEDMRFRQAMQVYDRQLDQYMQEAQAIGGLQAAGNQNLFNQQQALYGQLGSIVDPLINMNYSGNNVNPYEDAGSYNLLDGLDNELGNYSRGINDDLSREEQLRQYGLLL